MTPALDPAAQGSTRRLRPGMEGIGKIDAGRFRFVWIWTRLAVRLGEADSLAVVAVTRVVTTTPDTALQG